MKKILSVLLSAVMALTCCFCFGSNAFANDYTEIRVSLTSGSDAKPAIQEALNTNRGNNGRPIKVIVPAGSYTLSDHIILYSNTYLECTGAVFKKDYSSGTMIAIGLNSDPATGNSYYKNITINGGTFDADKKVGTILKFAHASGITVSNATFKNCYNSHHLGFAGCSDVTISGCTFENNLSTTSDNMEAIQIDILEAYHFPGLSPVSYDGTMTKNVTITNCTFNDVNRGVGSHSEMAGRYMENITITNNTFNRVVGFAVITSNYINANISNNVINDCGSGIYYRTIIPEYANVYATGALPSADPGSVISGNTISVVNTHDKNYTQFPYGIRVNGENVTADKKIDGGTLKAGDYRAYNVTVTGNHITLKSCANGIWIVGGVNDTVSSNTVTYVKGESAKEKCFALRIDDSKTISVSNNKLLANAVSYVENGLITSKSKDISISKNTISKAKKNGINISSSSTATLRNNTISSNGENGILCYNKSKINTSGNTIKNNKKHGIFIVNSKTNSSISKDKLQSNKGNGISLQKSNAKIRSVNAKQNKGYGIYLTQSASATLTKCTSSSNSKEGIYTTQKSKSTINGGTVSSNKGNGIYFTNGAKGSVKNVKVQKNKKKGIYLTKKVGKITLKNIKYSGNKGGKLKR